MEKIFDEISNALGLGLIIEPVNSVSGGYKHKMYHMKTSTGRYAIKLLDPALMAMDEAFEPFAIAEEIESILQKTDIPIVPALTFNEKKMQCIGGRYFYIFNWVEGTAKTWDEITEEHCAIIALNLAKIHKVRQDKGSEIIYKAESDWDNYIRLTSEKCPEITDILKENRDFLYSIQRKANIALKSIPNILSIDHIDLNQKNVLWIDKTPWIIDLEALSYENPYIGFFRIAMQWCGYLCGSHNANYGLLKAFIKAYKAEYGNIDVDWEMLYNSNLSMIDWLEFCIKRALTNTNKNDENGSPNNIRMIQYPMESLIYYESIKDEVLAVLERTRKGGS